jgi:hypothetical protein
MEMHPRMELSVKLLSLVPKLMIVALLFGAMPAAAPAQVSVGLSINIGPPALPVYEQPPCPAPGYIWTPGYWAWGGAGYYWVPGTWVVAPQVGYLWTPGYWGWHDGFYAWNRGYWGPYIGVGYVGGGWYGNEFRYNTAVTNVNTTVVRNVYVDKTVTVNNYNTVNHVAYNGGPGGVTATPTPEERTAMSESHLPPTSLQSQHQRIASQDRNSFASVNHGMPTTTAVAQPLSRENRPAGFEPLQPEDRAAAKEHVVTSSASADRLNDTKSLESTKSYAPPKSSGRTPTYTHRTTVNGRPKKPPVHANG